MLYCALLYLPRVSLTLNANIYLLHCSGVQIEVPAISGVCSISLKGVLEAGGDEAMSQSRCVFSTMSTFEAALCVSIRNLCGLKWLLWSVVVVVVVCDCGCGGLWWLWWSVIVVVVVCGCGHGGLWWLWWSVIVVVVVCGGCGCYSLWWLRLGFVVVLVVCGRCGEERRKAIFNV